MLFQPSNIYPSTFSGIGAGTVDVTQGLNVSWQVNGDTPMTAYQIKIYQNDSGSTLMYDSGSVTVSPAFEPHDKYGNATYFTAIISAAALSTAGIVNGYQYGYKMLITQWWGVSDYVEQTSASVFITRSTPNISIDAIPNPVAASSITITATYSQAQGDPISTVEWVFALAGSESNPIRKTGAISTQVLSFDADGLITGNTYSIMCNVVTSTGMEASTGFVQFPVLYSSSSLGINYQLAQLKNSSAVYLSWDNLESNILAYPYTDTTKTTNGITFTVNGEGDVVASGTATADAYFTIAEGTTSQLGITAGKKFVITSGYSGSKIVITETNGSNVVVSTIEGSDPLQYIATSTTNTLKFSIVIPSGAVLSSGQQLKPMIALEDKIVAYNDVSVNIEPIQDLHGYSNPWPAGGGVNVWDEQWELGIINSKGESQNSKDRIRSKNYIPVTPGATYYYCINSTHGIYTWGYDSSKTFVARVPANGWSISNNTLTIPNGVYYIRIVVQPGYGTTYNNDISINYPASVTSYRPYSNICPISGLTGLSVYRTGKNLCSVNELPANPTYYWGSNYSIIVNILNTLPTGTYTMYVTQEVVTMPSNGKVTHGRPYLTALQNGTQTPVLSYSVANDDSPYVGKTYRDGGTFTITEEIKGNFNNAYFYCDQRDTHSGNGRGTYNVKEIQIELGSTATTYEPYSGNTYSVDWSTQAGTVYHGTVDVVTGQLTVDRASVLFDGTQAVGLANWMPNSSSVGWLYNPSVTPGILNQEIFADTIESSGFISDTLKTVKYGGSTGVYEGTTPCISLVGSNNWGVAMRLNDTTLTTKAKINAYLSANPIRVVYKLATPLTYQLTPMQVAALVTNNVWTNAGDVTVSYTTDTGAQATLTGPIVSFSNTNAQDIPTPQFIPQITGLSIYRYLQGELALQHVYDFATGATSILDYFAPSQTKVSYLLVAHSNVGDLFLQTNDFVPTFWFYSVLLCDTDSNGNYHVSREYIFKYGVETGAVSNNNDPTIQKNFTPYPNRQPISTLYKTGKVSGYIGKTNNLNQYSDSISLQNAIYDISVSPLEKFLKTRKGDVIKVDTASSIQMKTEDNTTQQALKATLDWVEVGDSEQVSIVSVPTDLFWPL